MSVGNLKTQGNKGNNWTWQMSVLQLLGEIRDCTCGIPPYVPPTFSSFSIAAQAAIIEVGAALSGVKNFLWGTTTPANVQPNSIAIRDVTTNVLIASGLANDGSENVNIGVIPNAAPITHSWRAEGTSTAPAPFNSSNFTVSSIYPYFYGKVASGGAAPGVNRPLSNQALINSGTKVVASSAGTITVNFNSTSDDYIWFAVPASQPLKTSWFVNIINNGPIGGAVMVGGNLFPAPDLVSINSPTALWAGVNYNIYVSNYQSAVVVNMDLNN